MDELTKRVSDILGRNAEGEPYYDVIDELCGIIERDKESHKSMSQLLDIQGYDGNWNYDPYMHGMYNGMELLVATAEGREPVFKEAPVEWGNREHKLIDFDWLITNGLPNNDKSITGRLEKGWRVVAVIPATLIHPSAMSSDMATIFSKYTPYPKEENPVAECRPSD